MKVIFLACLFAFVSTHRLYDDVLPIDMLALAKKPEELNKFMDCLLDRGRCNDVYIGYRVYTPQSVRESCKRCTTDQKIFVYLFLETLKRLLPKSYHEFRHKYDPNNEYFDNLEAVVYKYKFEPCQ
nr:allergen Tha p 1-like [Danaus plexippus plexippus]